MKPLIGITLDSQKPGAYSDLPWYALRTEYFSAIARAGGIPVALPHELSCMDAYLERVDGLLLTGGDVDIPPEWYGAKGRHASVQINDSRTQFEWELAKRALAKDMPVLGVCAGEQLLNVLLGGTLIQHIPDEVPGALNHKKTTPRTEPWHEVEVVKGTLLHKIIGAENIRTNSSHHQAVKTVGKGVVINARASDGVIEGIESTAHRFCLGLEWHPELGATVWPHQSAAGAGEADRKIIAAFVMACGK